MPSASPCPTRSPQKKAPREQGLERGAIGRARAGGQERRARRPNAPRAELFRRSERTGRRVAPTAGLRWRANARSHMVY
jgi:hypothetical protein